MAVGSRRLQVEGIMVCKEPGEEKGWSLRNSKESSEAGIE